MSKPTTSFHLALAVPAAHMPAQRWLYSTIRTQIPDGALRPGAQVPSTRELARLYGLSRGTIVGAFEQLAAEGYLEGIIGSDTRVSETLPEDWLFPLSMFPMAYAMGECDFWAQNFLIVPRLYQNAEVKPCRETGNWAHL